MIPDCIFCQPVSGFYLGTGCPHCLTPFRNMKTLKQVTITPKFVQYIPNPMEQGILYISKEYGVANHLCLCGCGEQTVTPIGNAAGWQLIENDDKVSLTPSISNYQMPCKSHYVLTNNVANFI